MAADAALGAVAVANPWLAAGMAVISALGSSSKIDASSAATQSGLGVFAAENNVKKKPASD